MSLRIRRGGNVTVVPPAENFGPVGGEQTVRDLAKPNVILDSQKPGGATDVSPGSFTQGLCNSLGIGAKMWLLAGTHTVTGGIQPLQNQQIWCQNGAIIDGGNSAGNFLIAGPAPGIQIHGGTWQNQGNASSSFGASSTALLLTGTIAGGGGWLVEDVTVINNYNRGISFGASNSTVRRFKCNLNGRYGITLAGPNDGGLSSNCVLERGEIGFNNSRNLDPGDDAGGTKFVYGDASIMRYLWAHDNNGMGLWWDGPNQEHQVYDNVSENNDGMGIFYEIGVGGTSISHNYLIGNGNPADGNYPFNAVQIVVSCAPCDGTFLRALAHLPGAAIRGEISYNDIDTINYQTPIVLYNHGVHPPAALTTNWYVHHNRCIMRGISGRPRNGIADACSPAHVNSPSKVGKIGLATSDNDFDYNEYHVADIASSALYYEHDTGFLVPGPRTFVDFQSRGHEAHGTVTTL